MMMYEYLFIILTALALGSFMNVLIYRLPLKQSLWERSRCDHCGITLSVHDLLPVVSYVMQRGTCCYCGKRISVQYPLIELWSAVIAIGIFYYNGINRSSVECIVLLYLITVIMIVDYRYYIIPNLLVIILGLIGIFRILLNPEILINTLIGAVTMAAVPVISSLFFYLVRGGTGFGMGDIKLLLVLGFYMGFPGSIVVFSIAVIIGATVGLIGIVIGKCSRYSKLPFGFFVGLAVYVFILFMLIGKTDNMWLLWKNYMGQL